MTTTTTVFITGASAGIGEAVARRFAQVGDYQLVLTGRRYEELEKIAASLSVPTHILCFDVRDDAAMLAAVNGLPKAFADIDVLVNNAGVAFGMERAQDYDIADWDAMVDINIKGLLHVTHALLPRMVKRNRGHIINMGSVAATHPYVGGNVYGATKAFVYQFSQNLRADLLGTNLRVTVIEPGLVKTDFFKSRFRGNTEKAASVFKGLKALEAVDIAETVFWSVSQPEHVNINLIELMPTCQAPSTITLNRKG